MVFGLASSVAVRRFDHWTIQSRNYSFSICYFSCCHIWLQTKSKDWLDRIRLAWRCH